MPGITGMIRKRIVGNEEALLERMLRTMCHEPFYTSGTYIDRQAGVFLGHVSIQGSFSDCMPVCNEKKDLALFLAGECYLDRSVLRDLSARGHEFNPENASALIHLYEEQGEQFWQTLNGWFSGLLIDTRRGQVVLFNDRYGMQRLYCHEGDEAFYFSSEAKSLLKVLPGLRTMDPQTIGDYFLFDCAIENRTYFSGVSLLPPGSRWTWANGRVTKDRYFEVRDLENQQKLGKAEYLDALGDTFDRVLPRYFSGSGIGLALTGGLDSRMILACRKPAAGELPCFTFGGMNRETVDIRVSRRVAEMCHQTYRVIRAGEDLLSEFPSQFEKAVFVTDGLARVNNSSEIYFNRKVREIAPIKMTGKFASQVVRGTNVLKPAEPNMNLVSREMEPYLTASRERFRNIRRGHNLSFLIGYEIPWYFSGTTAAEYSQLTVRSPYLDNEFIELLYRAPDEEIDFGAFQLDTISKHDPKLTRIMTNRGLGGGSPLQAMPRRALYKFLLRIDTLFVQAYLPYSLHHRVARLDRFQMSRWVMGFDKFLFYRVWFQKELSGYLKEILLDRRTLERPYWNRGYIEKMVLDHIEGKGNYLLDISKVLTLEMIHRVFIDGSGSS